MVVREEDEELGEAVQFAFIVPDCDPGARLSVYAPDGMNLIVPCPLNVKPGMKLVLRKNEEGLWRITHAKEAVVSPAKFAVTPSAALDPPTPTRAQLLAAANGTKGLDPPSPTRAQLLSPAHALAPPPASVEKEWPQPPCWAEPRLEQNPGLAENPCTSDPFSGEVTPASGNRSTRQLSRAADAERLHNRTSRSSPRMSRSKSGRGASPSRATPSTSRSVSRASGNASSSTAANSKGTAGSSPNISRTPGARSPRSSKSAAPPALEDRTRSNEVEKLKELIRGVYQRKKPAKLSELDALLEKHKGDEKGIYEHICRKYGETPKPIPKSH